MNLCSVVVQTRPSQVDAVRKRLLDLEGVEVHATTAAGKLVVTVEHADQGACGATIMDLHNVDGVLSAALVYEYHDPTDPNLPEVSS